MNLEDLENDELISLCSKLLKELKRWEIIRTNNSIGELSEFIVSSEYKKIFNYLSYHYILEEQKNCWCYKHKGGETCHQINIKNTTLIGADETFKLVLLSVKVILSMC